MFVVSIINRLVHPIEALPKLFDTTTDLLTLSHRINRMAETMHSDQESKIVMTRAEIETCSDTLFSVTCASLPRHSQHSVVQAPTTL